MCEYSGPKEMTTSDPLCGEILGMFMIFLQEQTMPYVLKYCKWKGQGDQDKHTFPIHFSKVI